jgi:hypothetical protein
MIDLEAIRQRNEPRRRVETREPFCGLHPFTAVEDIDALLAEVERLRVIEMKQQFSDALRGEQPAKFTGAFGCAPGAIGFVDDADENDE